MPGSGNTGPGPSNVGNYQYSPIPGNPTPPLTPYMSPPYINNPDVKPDIADIKPIIPSKFHSLNFNFRS